MVKYIHAVFSLAGPALLLIGFVAFFNVKLDAVGISFLIIAIQSTCALMVIGMRCTNFLTVYSIFTLVFFSLIPWLHYSEGHYMWRHSVIPSNLYLFANILIIISNLLMVVTYTLTKGKKAVSRQTLRAHRNRGRAMVVLLLMSVASFLGLLYLNGFSLRLLLFRGLVDGVAGGTQPQSSIMLVLGMSFRLTPLFCFLYSVVKISGYNYVKLLLLIILVFSVFPTGVARFLAAFVYIPVLLVLLPSLRRAWVFSGVLVSAIVFVFPFLEQFRYFSGWDSITFSPNPNFFRQAHFDAYENMLSAIEAEFVTYGYQLLGVLLFFVPRAFWQDKPVGSGYQLAENLGYRFNNISMPFLGEGYVNFGIIGFVLFSISAGFSMARLDKAFSGILSAKRVYSYEASIYLYLIGALFFFLRGDLLSSFSFTVAGLAVAFLVARTVDALRF